MRREWLEVYLLDIECRLHSEGDKEGKDPCGQCELVQSKLLVHQCLVVDT